MMLIGALRPYTLLMHTPLRVGWMRPHLPALSPYCLTSVNSHCSYLAYAVLILSNLAFTVFIWLLLSLFGFYCLLLDMQDK